MYLNEVLAKYKDKDIYPFHMPGHKRQVISHQNPYEIDMTEVEGVDDLHDPLEVIKKEHERIARLYGAKESFMLVGGSTVGNLSAVYGSLSEEDKILIQRNSHKSIYNSVSIRHLQVDYIDNSLDENGIYKAVTVADIEKSLVTNPDTKAVFITSPTYEGLHCNIEEIAEYLHQKGILLLVDQAHGAHLGFNDIFLNSAAAYADITIQSLHKTLPALTQTAVLHISGDRVNSRKIQEALDIFETSSPSYVLMNSISECMDILDISQHYFEKYVDKLCCFYESCEKLKHLKLLNLDYEKKDPGKLVILTTNTNITGKELADILREEYKIETEMASFSYVIAMTSIMDKKSAYEKLRDALFEIDETLSNGNKELTNIKTTNIKSCEIWEAKASDELTISLKDAIEQVSASMICIYPPGSPIVIPGEIITEENVELINKAMASKLHVTGVNEGMVSVVKNANI